MKRLLLLRHGQAAQETDAPDIKRKLTPLGIHEANKVKSYLEKSLYFPDYVLCSSAQRTRETCNVIIKNSKTNPKTEIREELYNADPHELLETINSVPSTFDNLLVIAHNPGITSITNEFDLAGDNSLLPKAMNTTITCKLVVFEFNCNKWQNLVSQKGILKDVFWPLEKTSS